MSKEILKIKNDFEAKFKLLEENFKLETSKVNAKLDQLEKRLNLIDNNGSATHSGNSNEALNAKIELLIQMMDKKDEKYNLRMLEFERQIEKIEQLAKESKFKTLETMRSDFNKTANRLMVINESKLSAVHSQSQDLFENVAVTVEKYEKLFDEVKTVLQTTSNSPNIRKSETAFDVTHYNDLERELSVMQSLISNNFNKIKSDFMYFSDDLSFLHSEVYTWKLSNMRRRMEQTVFECDSELFPVQGYFFQARVKLTLKDNNIVYLSLCFKDAKNFGKSLGLKVAPTITFILKDVSGNENIKDTVRPFPFMFGSNPIFDQYTRKCQLRHKSWLLNSIYNSNDSIIIKILIEPQSIAQKVFSNDGILIWKINNYYNMKKKSKDLLVNYVKSPYFYTSSGGYRAQVSACLNGLGAYQGIGVTVTISFLMGLNDQFLNGNFLHKATFILFNQSNPTDHLIKSATNNLKDTLNYFVDLETHNNIEKNGFLINESLILKVIVEPT